MRLIPRNKGPEGKVLFCFADFENSLQTTVVINTLQGYRFDKDDIWGLQFSYAKAPGGAQQNALKNINKDDNASVKENSSLVNNGKDKDEGCDELNSYKI